jgi:hypothetical protein
MYQAIGKEEWEALPNIIDNPDLAATLNGGETFWAYTYMFPHATRAGVTCTMEAGISYSKMTGLFTKYVQAVEEAS